MSCEQKSVFVRRWFADRPIKCFGAFSQEDFVKNYVFPVLRANGIYESRYLMGTSLARPCIAKSQVFFGTLTQ